MIIAPSRIAFTLLELYPLQLAYMRLCDASDPNVRMLEDFCRPLRLSRSRLESKNDRTPGRFRHAAEWMAYIARETIKLSDHIKPADIRDGETLEDVRSSIRGHVEAIEQMLHEMSVAA